MESQHKQNAWFKYVQEHWFGVVLTAVGVLVIAFGLLFWVSQEKENEMKAGALYDKAVSVLVYALPQVATNAQAVNEVSQYVLARLDSAQRQYPRTISSMRARILLARLYAQNYLSGGGEEAYNQALQLYDEVARLSSKTFYQGLALLGKAQLLEHHSDWQAALETYRAVARKYQEFYTPYAWVSLGRVSEIMGDKNTAETAYQTVVQKYTNSGWYGLALGRLTALRYHETSRMALPVSTNVLPMLGQ